jgi:large subunit ribosomal protein L16
MLLFPEKTKYKKYHKFLKKLKKKETKNIQPTLGFSGLKSMQCLKITAKQIETLKKVIISIIKKKYKYKTKLKWNLFPDIPMTKKSAGIRMGKGKGNVEYWCFMVKKGRILCEFNNILVPFSVIFNSFILAANKLSIKTMVIL